MSEFYITTDQAEDGAWPEGMVKWNVDHVDVVHKDRSSMYPDFKKTIFIGGSRNSKENIRAWKDILNNHYGIAKSDKDFMDIFWYEYIEKEMFKRKEEKEMAKCESRFFSFVIYGVEVNGTKASICIKIDKTEGYSEFPYKVSVNCNYGLTTNDFVHAFMYETWEYLSTQLSYDIRTRASVVLSKSDQRYFAQKLHAAYRYFRDGIDYRLGDKKKEAPKPTMSDHIKKVVFNDPATIVIWEDGTKTVVKAQDGEHYDPEKGLAMAIAKKVNGNRHDYYNVFKKWLKKVPEQVSVFGEDVKTLVIPASIEKDVIEFLQWKDKERIDAEFAKSQAEKEE